VIGSGTYGKVYRSIAQDTQEVFAVKSIPMEKFRRVAKLNEFTKNEIFVLKKINHPNIIKFVD
jgi:serine/threonine protein kinase